jgi:hypothetical protein
MQEDGDPLSVIDDNFFDLDNMYMAPVLHLTLCRKHISPVKHLSLSLSFEWRSIYKSPYSSTCKVLTRYKTVENYSFDVYA